MSIFLCTSIPQHRSYISSILFPPELFYYEPMGSFLFTVDCSACSYFYGNNMWYTKGALISLFNGLFKFQAPSTFSAPLLYHILLLFATRFSFMWRSAIMLVCSKMNYQIHCYQLLFGAEGKIVQIGQTEAKSLAFCEPEGVL